MPEPGWYKGSLHAHTTESDGDESPERVIEWFRDHGYDWLVLSDHNLRTVVESGGGGASDRPIMIPGEEVTVQIEGQEKAVYVNAVGISTVVEPIDAREVLATIQANVNAVLRAGGIASLTAPYFRPGFDHESVKEVDGPKLMEVYNAHPLNVLGNPNTFSYEGIWDAVLATGKVVYGTATDDSHHYLDFSPDKSNPGRAWVMTRAEELSEEAIVNSLSSGNFYASTGVSLKDLDTSPGGVSVEIEPADDHTYRTTFISRGGAVLGEHVGLRASYRISGDEGYVRARIASSAGARAWTQPVFTGQTGG